MLGDAVQGNLFGSDKKVVKSLLVETRHGEVVEIAEGDPYWDKSARIKDYRKKNNALFYHSKSGVHKEVRTGNFPRAWAYARLIDHAKPKSAKSYLRGIWGEEVGNLDLLKRFYDGTDLRDIVRLFSASFKDWEVAGDRGIFSPDWYRVAAKYGWRFDQQEKNPPRYDYPPDPYKYVKACFAGDEMEKLFELLVMTTCWTPKAKEIQREVRRAMSECLVKVVPPRDTEIANKMKAMYHGEELLKMWGHVSGAYGADASEYHPVDAGRVIDIPWIEDYVLDVHTWTGKARLKKVQDQLAWGKPMVGRVDLRFSGAESGTLWRYLAFQQHGTVEVPWESVIIPDGVRGDYFACVDGIR